MPANASYKKTPLLECAQESFVFYEGHPNARHCIVNVDLRGFQVEDSRLMV